MTTPDAIAAFRASPQTQTLVKAIEAETELTEARRTAGEIAEQLSQAVRRTAEADPQAFNRAHAVLIPRRKGNTVLILCDPALDDVIKELTRYAQAGDESPLAKMMERRVKL